MRQYTDITVLLDRSGSMAYIQKDMEGALNEFIKGHQANPTTRLTLIQFDNQNDHEVSYENTPIVEVSKVHLNPRGTTPLVDAFVKAIDCTGQRLARMNEADRPDQVLFVVITDGAENASRKFKRTDVMNRVTHQTNNYKWQFIYLGANQDAIGEAATYGISHNHAITYTASAEGLRGLTKGLVGNTVAYANSMNRQDANYLQWSNQQRQDANQAK